MYLNFFLKGDFHLNREIDDFRKNLELFVGKQAEVQLPKFHPYAPRRSRIRI